MIHLQKAMDEDYVFQSLMNMLKQSHSFFYPDHGVIQSQLLSLFDLTEMSPVSYTHLYMQIFQKTFHYIKKMLIYFKKIEVKKC